MTARTPRIAITLPPEICKAITRLSKLTGEPASRIVADALSESAPALSRIADAIERVQKVSAEKHAVVKMTLADAEHEARQNAATVLALLDRIASDDQGSPGAAAQRAPRVPARRRTRKPPSR